MSSAMLAALFAAGILLAVVGGSGLGDGTIPHSTKTCVGPGQDAVVGNQLFQITRGHRKTTPVAESSGTPAKAAAEHGVQEAQEAQGSALHQQSMSRRPMPDPLVEAPLERGAGSSLLQSVRRALQANYFAMAVVAAFAVIAVGWGFLRSTGEPAERTPSAGAGAERSLLLDNAKVFSQFLVIFGHFIWFTLDGEYKGQAAWLSGAHGMLTSIGCATSPLKMPLLVFISGICSQGEATPSRLRRFFVFLVAPTCIWIFFAKPVIYDTLIDGSFGSAWDRFLQALTLGAFHTEWNLQALIFWRGATYLIWSHLHPAAATVGMFGASLAGGYMSWGNAASSNLKIDEALGHLPYFALGYIFPYERVLHAVRKPGPIGSAFLFAVVLAYTTWFSTTFAGMFPDSHGPYGYASDKEPWAAAEVGSLAHGLYWLRRLAKVLLEMSAGLVFMFLVLPRSRTFISWAGQHTLHPYVWHLVGQAWWDRLLGACHLPTVTSPLGHAAVIALNAAVSVVLLAFFSSRQWRSLFAWCFSPTWLQLASEKGRAAAPNGLGAGGGAGPPGGGAALGGQRTPAPGTLPGQASGVPPSLPSPSAESGAPGSKDPKGRSSAPGGAGKGPALAKAAWRASVQLPTMGEAKERFARYVLPCYLGVVILSVTPLIILGPARLISLMELIPLSLVIPFFAVSLVSFSGIRYGFHLWRLRASMRPPPPPAHDAEPLLHVCVVVQYKEPIEVLSRTVESIAKQSHIRRRPVLVVATEARDQERHETCEVLKRLCGDAVEEFVMTEHELQPGESVGKHSNENRAVREVYRKFVDGKGMSPFQIMLTIVDADSILSQFYLAHAEAAFYGMPDGRRLIYNGPINTYRNLDEAGILVQFTEVIRCHCDVFHDIFIPHHPQSNYSMMLGLAHEIDYWMPDCISEDVKCHIKALANNFGSLTTVPIPAFICNDLVVGVKDRYVQAKRHQWGAVEEFPWQLNLAFCSPLDFRLWWTLYQDEASRPGSLMRSSVDVTMFGMKLTLLIYILLYRPSFLWQPIFLAYCLNSACAYISLWTAEVWLWNTCLKEFPIQWPSNGRLALLILLTPIFEQLSWAVFNLGATWDCILHITFRSHNLTYVNAPKGSNIGSS